ncbi:MAG: phosphoglycerate dehydrogenase [Alphaproteobacteria bacterium]|nr:phosphoglycerate dehydrogenase [Alphaproteobacteria bacterium]
MPKVLIADQLSPRAVEIFRSRGVDVVEKVGLAPDALKHALKGIDGLAVRSATKVTKDVLAAADQLRVVGRAGVGIDNVDLPAATARGIVVMNTPFGNSITTAEHAVALMMALARQLPSADRSTRASKWEKNRFMGVELFGKTLGVIGCGNIGSIVASLGRGLRMKVISFDPYLSPERAADLHVEKVTLEALLARADFITLHVPLTDETRHVLDAKALAKTKKGVRIINAARGGLIDEAALKAAIESGQVAGAALDVFAVEPAKDNPLFAMEQVICTPHLGASTSEAQENVAIQVAEQMSDYLLAGAVTNALNMPSVSADEMPRLKPYMKLAEQLGSFAGQLTETGLKAATIEYEGDAATVNTRPLTAVVLQGLLQPLMSSVNMVNAPIVARERGIDIREVKREQAEDYMTMIRLTVTTERQTRSVAGTLFAGDKPRIIEIKGIHVEAELTPHMLYVTNNDKPGMIGALGKAIGDAGINIATFHLGRAAPGGDAIALISVDGPVPEPVLDQLRALPNIVQVRALKL